MIMEVENLEEENPLQNYTEVQVNRAPLNFKNNVGRPKKNSQIKFSAQPKSIVSLLLSENETKREDYNLLVNKVSEKPLKEKKSTCEEFPEGVKHDNIYNKQTTVFQSNKLYVCNHINCTYSTKFPSNLKTHKRIHTPEKQYICDECTFRSKFISSLKTHKRLHKAERPYACRSCEYKCNSCSNLKKHIVRWHTKDNANI
ncbi:unnamed protein product [Euphydryas editha]|uniref:C2H2-type domain-containing protein n=1 Tax=Euphydryas editha TaxID=104508 RepID=A0AAU9UN53_EUPED|nr:unnamed protein product [Euphydryas editha]